MNSSINLSDLLDSLQANIHSMTDYLTVARLTMEESSDSQKLGPDDWLTLKEQIDRLTGCITEAREIYNSLVNITRIFPKS